MAGPQLLVDKVEGIAEALAAREGDTRRKLVRILQVVGIETVAYLRSLTSEMRPPKRGARTMRRAHPGHWADATGALANAYAWAVTESGDEVSLALTNSMDYAVHLEARDGFFVLRGVTEEGGPVRTAIVRAVAIVAPDWEVRFE